MQRVIAPKNKHMNETNDSLEFNRRDFLRGGSVATLMAMLGGVPLLAQKATGAEEQKPSGPTLPVAVIGLGPWGREILTTLAQQSETQVAAICDTYGAFLRRSGKAAPGAAQESDYQKILANPDIKAVIIATPTYQHKQIVLDALAAGKHVYCEAPLAHTLEDAKAIALAAKANAHLVFQAGYQLRSDPQRHFLLPFIRSGALGTPVMGRAQWHKKQSWRSTSPDPDREKVINWRLSQETSPGLVGELGCHQIDQANWFWDALPTSVTGFGSIAFWKDGRDVPDTVHAIFEYPSKACLNYDATLCNSFDANYEMFFGTDAAVMLRGSNAWMFKEVDSPLLGWEVYAKKELFYKETGIALKADGSKSVNQVGKQEPTPEELIKSTPLFYSLQAFVRNSKELVAKAQDMQEAFGEVDKDELAKVPRRASSGYLDAYQATVCAIKANEAINAGMKVEIPASLYELS